VENEFETKETQENDVRRLEPAGRSAVPRALTITVASLLIWLGFQTVQLVLERNNLLAVNSNFQAGMREAEKMRVQLETLITKTAELASKGNPNARAVIEELKQKGIPLPSATPPAKQMQSLKELGPAGTKKR
jgi:hypothetical protein